MNKKLDVYIGTLTEPGAGQSATGKGKGIYRCELDLASGTLVCCEAFGGIKNPTYLAVSKSHTYLFCVNEINDYNGGTGGAVSAFSIEPGTGKLALINTVASHGGDPCSLCVNDAETYVFAANYMTGSVSLFPVGPEGKLSEASCVIQHTGSSVTPGRQQGPHAHSVVLDEKNKTAFVSDLGIDRVMAYRIDEQNNRLLPLPSLHIPVTPGAGPRHGVFNRDTSVLYVINELSLAISVYAYSGDRQAPRLIQTFEPVKNETGDYSGADIAIHPKGAFLYASIRGANVLLACQIDAATHKLHLLSKQPSGGKTPRNFCIDPTGQYLLAGNQDSDTVAVFSIDGQNGGLTEKSRISVPAPMCIKF
jgi:6-phosphogluconolactonase